MTPASNLKQIVFRIASDLGLNVVCPNLDFTNKTLANSITLVGFHVGIKGTCVVVKAHAT